MDRRLSIGLLEREYVRAVLESVNGNKREAAAILQIDRRLCIASWRSQNLRNSYRLARKLTSETNQHRWVR